jgi:hypothetical protein
MFLLLYFLNYVKKFELIKSGIILDDIKITLKELVEKSKRGGYMLKTGFAYNATTPVTVRVFKEDTNFPLTGETKYTYLIPF